MGSGWLAAASLRVGVASAMVMAMAMAMAMEAVYLEAVPHHSARSGRS